MADAAALFHKPLSKNDFFLGDYRFLLKQGLISTCADVNNFDTKTLQKAAVAMGAIPPVKRQLALKLIQSWAQLEWYKAKGAEPPDRVQQHFTAAYEEACQPTQK